MSAFGASAGHLRYGDLIVLEVRLEEEQAEVGILSAETLVNAGRRLAEADSDNISRETLLCVSRFVKTESAPSQRSSGGKKQDRENGNKKLQRTNTSTSNRDNDAESRDAKPPHDIFVNGVMQIAAGQGFEAAGEPVHYGSHIKLINMRAGQYLCAKEVSASPKPTFGPPAAQGYSKHTFSKITTVLQLVSPEELVKNENSKECIFRVLPRFGNLRAEGDRVMFEDLIVISHFSGRTLYRAASDKRVVLSENPAQKTSLRLYPFLPYSPSTEHALRAGMVVQFYHKVVNAFMTVDATYGQQQQQLDSPHQTASTSEDVQFRSAELAAVRPDATNALNADSCSYDVKAVVRLSTLIDKSSGFWRLETLPLRTESSQRRVNGLIRPGTRLRLRHVLYDKYLALKTYDKADALSRDGRAYHVILLDCPGSYPLSSNSSEDEDRRRSNLLPLADFEVHLLSHEDSSRDGNPIIELGSNLRLRHVISGNYLTVGLDENESQYVFQCSSRDFDKDVYKVLPARADEIATVATAKLTKSLLDDLLQGLLRRGHDYDVRMLRATAVLQSLIDVSAEGFLASRIDAASGGSCYAEVDLFRQAQNIANELGYVQLLLQIAEQACSRTLQARARIIDQQIAAVAAAAAGSDGVLDGSGGVEPAAPDAINPSLSEVEDDLARAAYAVLGTLIRGNREVVESVVESGGVQLMMLHLNIPSRGIFDWTPPLLELVDASYATSDDSSTPITLISEEDLCILLDQVSDTLAAGKTPSKFTYQFLARVCRPGDSILTGSQELQNVNHKMQSLICSHLLGSSTHRESPFWSLMVYRTFIDEVEEEGITALDEAVGAGSSSKRRVEKAHTSYSLYQSKSFLTPGFAQLLHGTSTAGKRAVRHRLLITTTPYGQIRPHTSPLEVVRPPNLSVHECSDGDLNKVISLRNRISLMAMDPRDVKFFDVDEVVSAEPDFNLLMPYVHRTMQAVKWKELQQLDKAEREFYCASLDLIAALCAGRNILTQNMVKRYLPVDHILLALDTVSALKPGATVVGQTAVLDPLRPVRTALQNVLFHCYIDSAMLPPIPSSGLDSIIRSAETSTDFDSSAERWDDVFVDECYGKVFSLISQEDDNLIEITEDMHEDDLVMCLRSLDTPQMKSALAIPEKMPRCRQAQLAIELSQREFFAATEYTAGGGEGEDSHSAQLIQYLHCLRDIQKANLAARNVKSLQQRAYLEFQLMYFVRCQSAYDWHEGVQKLLLEFTGPRCGPHRDDHVSGSDAVSGKISANTVAVVPLMATVASTEMQQFGHGNVRRSRGKSSNELNFRLAAKREKDRQMSHAQQIRSNTDAVLMQLKLIHALLLRRFFDYEYNANPFYADSSPKPEQFKRQQQQVTTSSAANETELFRGSVDEQQNSQQGQRSSLRKGGLYAPLDSAKTFPATATAGSGNSATDSSKQRRSIQEITEFAKRHDRAPFYDLVMADDFAMIPQRLCNGKQVLRMVINSDRFLQMGQNGPIATDLWRTRAKQYANTGPIREILFCVLSIISDAPGNVIDPRFDLNDDEKQMDEYFRRQFGYVTVPAEGTAAAAAVQDLISGVVEVKLLCCRIAVACLELLHSKTASALNQIFFQCFEEVRLRKLSAQQDERNLRMSSINQWNSLQAMLQQSLVGLSAEQSIRFRHDLRKGMERKLTTNYDMIWNAPEFFHEETFRILTQQIYFNSPELRAEALNLLYRCNSFRAQLAEYLLKELQESRVGDQKGISYVARQRSALQQVLSRFHFTHRHHTPTNPAASDIAGGNKEEEQEQQQAMADLMFRLDGFKLKKVLLNTDTGHGSLGLISFCFQNNYISKSESESVVNDSDDAAGVLSDDAISNKATDAPAAAATRPGIRRLKSSKLFQNKHLLRQFKAEQLLVRTRKCSMNSAFEEILDRKAEELNQIMLVDLDVHRIVLEFLSKYADEFIQSLRPRTHSHTHSHAHSRNNYTATPSAPAGVSDGGEQAADGSLDGLGAMFDPDCVAAAENTAKRLGFSNAAATFTAGAGRISNKHMGNNNTSKNNKNNNSSKHPVNLRTAPATRKTKPTSTRSKIVFSGLSDDELSDNDASSVSSDSDNSADRAEEQRISQRQKAPVPTAKRRVLHSSSRQRDYVRVFDLCFLFLRALIRNNATTAAALTTKQTITTAVSVRHYCSEAGAFLCELIAVNREVMAAMADQDFIELLKDLKDIAARDSIDSPLPISQFGLSVSNCCMSLRILSAVGTCSHDLTDNRLRQLRDALQQELAGAGDLTVLERLMYMGIGQAQFSAAPAAASTAIAATAADVSERSHSQGQGHIAPDVRFMTLLYYAETGRTTFSRLPGHVLMDKLLQRDAFSAMKPAIASWQLLPQDSVLQLHLQFIRALGSIALRDLGIQKYCLQLVRNPKVIFQLLMIDKYEIRDAYLRLLHGIWFSGLPNSPSPAELLTADYKEFMLALFYSFIQDMRLYSFIKKDLVLLKQHQQLTIIDPPPFASSTNSRSSNSNSWDEEKSQRLAQHGLLLESYLLNTVLPFVKYCADTNLIRSLDFGVFARTNSSGDGSGLPVRRPVAGKLRGALFGSASSTSSPHHHHHHHQWSASASSPVVTAAPASANRKANLRPTQKSAAPPAAVDGGLQGLLPFCRRPNRQLLQEYVLELSLVLADTVNSDVHAVSALLQSAAHSSSAKSILRYGRRYSGYLSSKESDYRSIFSVHLHVLSRAVDCLDINEASRFSTRLPQQQSTMPATGGAMKLDYPASSSSSKAAKALALEYSSGGDSGNNRINELQMEQALKFNCIQEFLVEVDRYIAVQGLKPEHLLHLEEPRVVYIGDQEFTNGPKLETDPNATAGAGNTTKVDIILNPMNSKCFDYSCQQMARTFVSYARHCDEPRYQQILTLMSTVNDNRELKLSELGEGAALLPDFIKKQLGDVGIVDHISGLVLGSKRRSKRDSLEEFSKAQFQRWSRDGGLFLEQLLKHMLYCLSCYQQQQRLQRVSFSMDDIVRCNVYWMNTFTKGILRSSIADMYELYSDQTETQIKQVDIECKRLRLMQDTFQSLGAHEVMVKVLGVSADKLRSSISVNSIRLMRHSAIDLSIALTQTGNRFLQNSIIDTIHRDYEHNQSLGISEHFMQSLRFMLQEQSQAFSSGSALDPLNVREVRKLLESASLLCEGHNDKAQNYLGSFNVVLEVANFVHDMSRLLAREMEFYLMSAQELTPKHWPLVLGQYRRPLIRWITPLPSSLPNSADAANYAEYKFLDVERLALLCELVQAGFEALAEFCQRPCFSNQQAIARAGCANDLHIFLRFFGAFQMVNVMQPAADENESERFAFTKEFNKQVGVLITHEAVHPLPAQAMQRRVWIGSDPLAMNLTADDVTCVSQGQSKSQSKSALQATGRHYRGPDSASSDTGGGLCGFLNRCCGSCLSGRDAQVHSGAQAMRLGNASDWIRQKEAFHSYLKHQSSNSASGIENNYYFQLREFGQVLADLESSCLKFAGSLLEGSVMDEQGEVPHIVVNSIGPENLIANMSNYWDRYLSYHPLQCGATAAMHADDCYERRMAYDYYALVMRITDMTADNSSNNSGNNINAVLPMVQDWIDRSGIRVDSHIARIEVRSPEVERSNALVVAYFPIPKVVHNYWSSSEIRDKRNNILFPTNVGTRDSADEKVKTFLKEGDTLIATLRHLESLDEIWAVKNAFFHLLVTIAHRQSLWSNITFILTVLINLMLVFSVKTNGGSYSIEGSVYLTSRVRWEFVIDQILWVHVGFTGMLLFAYTVMHGWLYVKLQLRDNPDGEFELRGKVISRLGFVLNRIGIMGSNRALLAGDRLIFRLWPVTCKLLYLVFHWEMVYYLMLLVSSLAARLVAPLFIAINLVEILRLSKLMQYVTRAFTANIDQVTATVVLAAVLMFMFTTLGYSVSSIRNHYYFDNQGISEDGVINGCPTLAACVRMHLDYGLVQAVFWEYTGYIASVEGELFNFAFVFIMQIVIPGLISGIIIDTFSEMRGNKQAVEEDVANTCFICNIDREDFELVNVPFERHVHDDHNMWKYLWFIIYLSERDHTDFDGIEQFCSEVVSEDGFSTRWLPVKMARGLSSLREKYDLFTIVSKITMLQARVEKIEPFVSNSTSEQTRALKEQIKDMSTALAKRLKQQQQLQQQQMRTMQQQQRQQQQQQQQQQHSPIRGMHFSVAESQADPAT